MPETATEQRATAETLREAQGSLISVLSQRPLPPEPAPPTVIPPGKPLNEDEFADLLGIGRADLKRIRDESLRLADHFTKSAKVIKYTPAGVSRIVEILSLVGLFEKKEGADLVGGVTLLWVTGIALNKHIVWAESEKTGRVRVRVRSNENFTKFLKIKARLESGDLYVLEGRCPRFRGRW